MDPTNDASSVPQDTDADGICDLLDNDDDDDYDDANDSFLSITPNGTILMETE